MLMRQRVTFKQQRWPITKVVKIKRLQTKKRNPKRRDSDGLKSSVSGARDIDIILLLKS